MNTIRSAGDIPEDLVPAVVDDLVSHPKDSIGERLSLLFRLPSLIEDKAAFTSDLLKRLDIITQGNEEMRSRYSHLFE